MADSQRRVAHQPPAARRHAPLRRRRRGRPGRRRRRRRRQRPDPAAGPGRLAGRLPGRRAVLGPRHRLGQRRTRLAHPVLDRAAPDRRRQIRYRSARTTPAAASADRWSTTPATPPASTPPTSTPSPHDGVGADWPIDYADLKPYYEAIEAGTAGRRAGLALGRPALLPAPRPPGRRQRRDLPARREGRRYRSPGRSGRDPQRPVRQPAALHLPRLLPAGLQGQRQSQPADHPHPRRPGPRRRDPPRQPWSPASSSTTAPARVTGVTYLRAGVEHYQRARAVAVAGYSIETPRLLLLSATDRFPDGLGNDHDQVGRYLMVQGAPQTAGRFDDEIRMYKAPPPEVSPANSSTRPTRPSPTSAAGPSRPSARCRSPGPNTSPPKDTGVRRCANTCATTCTGPPSARCANSCRKPTTGSPWPTRPTGTACRSRTSPTANATTTGSSSSRHRVDGRHPARRRRQEVITIDRYAHLVGGARMAARAEDGVVDADHRVFGIPNLYIVDGSVLPTQGVGQPRADHHGAGRPRRRPAHHPRSPRPHRAQTGS